MFPSPISADIHIGKRVEARILRKGLWHSFVEHKTLYGEGDMCVTKRNGTEMKG